MCFHRPPFSLTSSAPPCALWFTVYLKAGFFFFFQKKKGKKRKRGRKLSKVLLARDMKGGNCTDLSSASFGICLPSSFFWKWGCLFHSRWSRCSPLRCFPFVSHYIHGKLMSGSDSEHRSAFITETVNFNYNQLFCAEAWTELPPSFFELSIQRREHWRWRTGILNHVNLITWKEVCSYILFTVWKPFPDCVLSRLIEVFQIIFSLWKTSNNLLCTTCSTPNRQWAQWS